MNTETISALVQKVNELEKFVKDIKSLLMSEEMPNDGIPELVKKQDDEGTFSSVAEAIKACVALTAKEGSGFSANVCIEWLSEHGKRSVRELSTSELKEFYQFLKKF